VKRASASGQSEGHALDTLACISLYITIFAIPGEVLVPLVKDVSAVKLVGGALVVVALLRFLSIPRIRKPSVIHALLVAFIAWSGLSYFWSVDPEATIVRTATYVQLLFVVWMVWELAPGQERIVQFIQAFVLGTIPSSAMTVYNALIGRTAQDLYQSTHGGSGPAGARYAAGEFNANDLGLMLAISIPMSVYLIGQNKSSRLRVLYGIQIALAVVSVLLTGSRSAAFAMVPALLCLGKLFWGGQSRAWILALLILALSAGGILLLPPEIWTRFLSAGSEISEGTLTHRTTIWSLAAETFSDAPFAGVGSGAFPQMSNIAFGRLLVAHNTYLSILVELGVIGVLIVASLFATMFYSALRLPPAEKWMWLGVLGVWMIGVAAGNWEYQKTTWMIFGLVAAHEGAGREVWQLMSQAPKPRGPLGAGMNAYAGHAAIKWREGKSW